MATRSVPVIYNQTLHHNDLVKSRIAPGRSNGGDEAMPPMNKLRSLGTSRKPHVVLDVTGFSGSVAHRNVSAIATAGTTMLKGPSGNHFALKAGDARPGTFVTEWNGARPPESTPIKKGAIILGDGSKGGIGTFFEGAITSVRPSDATDNAVQANVVAAHYGR